MEQRRGLLFLVVGPSGVGKDSLIDGARQRLAGDPGYHFARRLITRPGDAGGEDHQAVTEANFERHEAAGDFMLSWRAHGLRYGVPKSAEHALADGRSVIVNVSRQVIDQARARSAPVKILKISAPPDVLRARMVARRREADSDIDRRLAQASAYQINGDDVFEVINAGDLDDAIERFVALIEAENGSAPKLP